MNSCYKCKGKLNDTPVKFDGKYFCNWHIPSKSRKIV